MFKINGIATVTRVHKKETKNGFPICDVYLSFNTGLFHDKAKTEMRIDKIRAMILGKAEYYPRTNSKIDIIDGELRVNTWMAKNEHGIEKLQSMPEILINQWEEI